MIIGVPKEIKDNENRVSLTPGGAHSLVQDGHRVLVEQAAGEGSGFTDDEYCQSGAELVPTRADAWQRAEMVLKVKEPLPSEYPFLRPGLTLFTYLHLAAEETLSHARMDNGVTGIAYETVELADGSLPLLTPMSEVAGKMSIQIAAHYLEKTQGGRGELLGGVPRVRPADVVIIGGGTVGTAAAQVALGMGADVTVIDTSLDRLRHLRDASWQSDHSLFEPVQHCPGGQVRGCGRGSRSGQRRQSPQARHLRDGENMTSGSVIVDVGIDRGGAVETVHPTTHSNPTYSVDGVIHYGVTNMPGAVPRTSTYALSNATLPYVQKLANQGFVGAVRHDPALARGVNVYGGEVTYPAVAEAFNLPNRALDELI